MKNLLISILGAALLVTVIPVHALQIRAHEVVLSPNGEQHTSIPIANQLNSPILVRVHPPQGVQVYPRRVRLLPGERQQLRARQVGTLSEDARMGFTHVVEQQGNGSHARVTLRLLVRGAE